MRPNLRITLLAGCAAVLVHPAALRTTAVAAEQPTFLPGIPAAAIAPAAPAKAAAATPAADDLFDDPVIAKGSNLVIKLSQLEEAFIAYRANLAARGQSLPETQRATREAQLLDRLIITQLLVNRASDADKTKARDLAEKFTAETRKAALSEEAFLRQIKAMGLTPEQFNRRIQEQALAEAVVERELKSTIAITDAQVEAFYKTGDDALVKIMQDELERLAKSPDTAAGQLSAVKEQIDRLRQANLARLQQPEKVRVSHVFLATRNRETQQELPDADKAAKRKLIEQLLTRARAGEDFAKLVQEFSEDQNKAESKGEYVIGREDPFTPEFKAAAFSLATNQVSEVVSTLFGLHVIKLHEKIPARKVELEKAAADIREHLLQQALQNQMPGYFARVKREAAVEIFDPKYRLGSDEAPSGVRPPG